VKIAPTTKQTREEFEQFLKRRYGGAPPIVAAAPWTIVACDCGDVNCHGWRIVGEKRCPTCGQEVS